MVAIIGMIIALWGGNTVFLSLIAGMMNSVLGNIEVDGEPFGLGYKNCLWMIIVAAFLIPITWLGTPKDFWWVNISFLININLQCDYDAISCQILGLWLFWL